MPMRGELRPISTRDYAQHPSSIENALSRVAAIAFKSDLQAVAIFCVIGLLLTVNVIVYFPNFGLQLAELSVFP